MTVLEKARKALRARFFIGASHAARKRIEEFAAHETAVQNNYESEIVVSLTSYPGRFKHLDLTIKSLLAQRIKQDRTVLWVATKDKPKLPTSVLRLEERGLEIRTCDDIRSYKKLIPSLRQFPEATIITADDDLYYPEHWLEWLLKAASPSGSHVICWRAHLAKFAPSGHVLSYADFDFDTEQTIAGTRSTAIFPTGSGGILYPPGTFSPEVLNEEAFMSLCPRADDVWFFWMARLAGRSHRRVAGHFEQVAWPGTQAGALFHQNWIGGENDMQMKQVENVYGCIPSERLPI